MDGADCRKEAVDRGVDDHALEAAEEAGRRACSKSSGAFNCASHFVCDGRADLWFRDGRNSKSEFEVWLMPGLYVHFRSANHN
jgi:hypothetical protein